MQVCSRLAEPILEDLLTLKTTSLNVELQVFNSQIFRFGKQKSTLANDFSSNVILRNRGDGTFEDVSAETGASDFATSMGVATGDIDNDGKTDIYVANMYSKMGRRIIGQVSNEDYPEGIYHQIKGSCAGNRLYLKGSHFQFQEESDRMNVNAVGWAYAPAMVDLDGDGWLDLYATTGFMSFSRTEPDG